jgi:CHAT domain-containing protein
MDGDLGTVDLRAEVAQWVERQLRRVGTVARKSDSSPEVVSRVLSDVGNSLYDQLLPQALKEICWVLRDRGVRSMLILSDEPHIPWELIKPYRANPVTGDFDEEGEFWGESFALTHWLRGRPPAEQLSFNRIFAVAAGGPSEQGQAAVRDFAPDQPTASSPAKPTPGGARLKAADEELSILRSFEAQGSRINVLPARTSELRQAFETGGFDLFHLACHGAFGGLSAGDASAVLMEDGTFSALDLSPRMAATLRRASPLIFFNACHSGRIGFSLTRLGSWGAQLVQMGCGGFVGSLWPVTDEGALAFARAFYDAISAGLPIGEAMLRARLEVRQIYPNDPTWMAYCCFADPMARIRSQ